MRLCVHGKPTDRPDLCVGCCHLAYALGLVTREQVMEWHGDAIRKANLHDDGGEQPNG